MNAQKIARTLKSLKLDDWNLLVTEQKRCMLHSTTKGAIETSIDAVRIEAHVTIYKRYGNKLGDARFVLFTDNPEEVKKRVKDALLICETAKKEAWPLAKQQSYASVKSADPEIVKIFKEGKQAAYLEHVAKQMTALIKKKKAVTCNHIEIHLTLRSHRILNSKGVDVSDKKSDLFVEAILMAKNGKEENEFHQALNYGWLADFNATHFVKTTAQQARDVLVAKKMSSVKEGGILLSGIALRDFWAPDLTLNTLAFHSSAMAKHRKLSKQKKGGKISSTKFTLVANPLIDGNPASRKCDDEGVASRKTVIVENGKWKELHASQRYATYLGVKATGILGVMEIEGENEKGLVEEGTIEIVGFSSFVPNSLSGDFSAEIRLAYLHKGGKKIPIRGAMFTGNLYKMLDSMRMEGSMDLDRYKGPALMRFDSGCHLAGF